MSKIKSSDKKNEDQAQGSNLWSYLSKSAIGTYQQNQVKNVVSSIWKNYDYQGGGKLDKI